MQTQAPPQTVGRYELCGLLGRGGMGAVYEAEHTKLQKRVALKLLPPELASRPEVLRRFEREMRAVGRVSHPGIVQALDADEADGVPYLAMELVDGMDLSEVARLVERKAGKPMSVGMACEAVRQAAEAVHAAHESGMVHRDLKPSNLMLDREGNVKVLDLGLAVVDAEGAAGGHSITSTGQVMGTVDYMSPEQAGASAEIDRRTDVYALAATLYRLLTGRPPYPSDRYPAMIQKLAALASETPEPVRERRPGVPQALSDTVAAAMAREPDGRTPTAADFAAALEPFARRESLAKLAGRLPKARPASSEAEVTTASAGVAETATVLSDAVAAEPVAVPAAGVGATFTPFAAAAPATRRRRRRRGGGGGKWWAALAGCGGLAAVLGLLMTLRTKDGLVRVEVPDGFEDRVSIRVLSDGAVESAGWQITPDGGDASLRVRAGRVELSIAEAAAAEYELSPRRFELTEDGRQVVRLTRLAADGPDPRAPRSPYARIDWPDAKPGDPGRPVVPVDGRDRMLMAVDGVPVETLIEAAGRVDAADWRRAFEEELVAVMTEAGSPPGAEVTLMLANPHNGKTVGTQSVAMTSANRRAVFERNHPAEGALPAGYLFDGVDDYAEIPGLEWDGTSPLTIEARVTPGNAAGGGDHVVITLGERAEDIVGTYFYGGRLHSHAFTRDDKVYVSAVDAASPGRTAHVATVIDGETMRLFVNGMPKAADTVPAPFPPLKLGLIGTGGLATWFGRHGQKPFNHFNGRIHDVRISTAARYADAFPPPHSLRADEQTVALYRFEGGIERESEAPMVLIDRSGNGYNGLLHTAGDARRAAAEESRALTTPAVEVAGVSDDLVNAVHAAGGRIGPAGAVVLRVKEWAFKPLDVMLSAAGYAVRSVHPHRDRDEVYLAASWDRTGRPTRLELDLAPDEFTAVNEEAEAAGERMIGLGGYLRPRDGGEESRYYGLWRGQPPRRTEWHWNLGQDPDDVYRMSKETDRRPSYRSIFRDEDGALRTSAVFVPRTNTHFAWWNSSVDWIHDRLGDYPGHTEGRVYSIGLTDSPLTTETRHSHFEYAPTDGRVDEVIHAVFAPDALDRIGSLLADGYRPDRVSAVVAPMGGTEGVLIASALLTKGVGVEFAGTDAAFETPPLDIDLAEPFTLEVLMAGQLADPNADIAEVAVQLGPVSIGTAGCGGWHAVTSRDAAGHFVRADHAEPTGRLAHYALQWDGETLSLHHGGRPVGKGMTVYGGEKKSRPPAAEVAKAALRSAGRPRLRVGGGTGGEEYGGTIAGVRLSRGVRYAGEFKPPAVLTADEDGVLTYDLSGLDAAADSVGALRDPSGGVEAGAAAD